MRDVVGVDALTRLAIMCVFLFAIGEPVLLLLKPGRVTPGVLQTHTRHSHTYSCANARSTRTFGFGVPSYAASFHAHFAFSRLSD